MQLLGTLTPNDYINAIWYNNRREFMLETCDKTRFIPATTQNKRLFQDFLGKVEERDQATLPPALNMSFNKFVSVCHFLETFQEPNSLERIWRLGAPKPYKWRSSGNKVN